MSVPINNNVKMENGKTQYKDKIRLPQPKEKQFKLRNSLLIDLFENPHIKSVRHMFIAGLLVLFINTVVRDYVNKGEIRLGLTLIKHSFHNVHYSIFLWIGFFLATCCTFLCFEFWAKVRISMSPKSPNTKIWDQLWMLSALGYYIASFRIAAVVVTYLQLAPASSAIVIIEQLRLLMKVHAYIRSNSGKVLSFKVHTEEELQLPKFSHFLYFLFAPTLIYRDEYPRTKEIRWTFVCHRILEVIGVLFYYSFILDRFVLPVYKDFGLRKFTISETVLAIFENTIPGMLLLMNTFFLILHSWLNLFAELLRFGDRLFYKDWWTCSTFSEYFRTWNVVVHDWLYTYIYKDMYEILIPKNKLTAKLAVFIVSAVVHEWILTYFLGYFFPALFIQFFFFGTALSLINAPKNTVLNILFWYGLAFGCGSLISVYTLEYFARLNAPIENTTYWNYLIPRMLTCDCFV